MIQRNRFTQYIWIPVLALLCGTGYSQVNLLTNPGIENWSGGAPSGWSYSGISYIDEDNGSLHGGNSSARFLIPTTSTTVELYQDISVTGGSTYTFSCWILDNTSQGEAGLLINWRDEVGSIGTVSSGKSADGPGWQQIVLENKQAPQEAKIARVRLRGYQQEGIGGGFIFLDDALFYDDISLSVMMNSLYAVHQNTEVVVRWTTESEVGTLGFHVRRSENECGPFERVTTAIIPGQGNSSSGTEYVFTDKNIEENKNYWYQIEELSADGMSEQFGPVYAVSQKCDELPEHHRLSQNYPNPFNPSTTIQYEISKNEAEEPISLSIRNMLGQKVVEFVHRIQNPGSYRVDWDGCGANGVEMPSGVYFYVLQSGKQVIETGRMLKME